MLGLFEYRHDFKCYVRFLPPKTGERFRKRGVTWLCRGGWCTSSSARAAASAPAVGTWNYDSRSERNSL